jgi:hypothetical protein
MEDDLLLCLSTILIVLLVYRNSNLCNEYYGTGPEIFNPEGYGEHGMYNDNIRLEPVYRYNKLPTIYDV